jgi:hypothetical protein
VSFPYGANRTQPAIRTLENSLLRRSSSQVDSHFWGGAKVCMDELWDASSIPERWLAATRIEPDDAQYWKQVGLYKKLDFGRRHALPNLQITGRSTQAAWHHFWVTGSTVNAYKEGVCSKVQDRQSCGFTLVQHSRSVAKKGNGKERSRAGTDSFPMSARSVRHIVDSS